MPGTRLPLLFALWTLLTPGAYAREAWRMARTGNWTQINADLRDKLEWIFVLFAFICVPMIPDVLEDMTRRMEDGER